MHAEKVMISWQLGISASQEVFDMFALDFDTGIIYDLAIDQSLHQWRCAGFLAMFQSGDASAQLRSVTGSDKHVPVWLLIPCN